MSTGPRLSLFCRRCDGRLVETKSRESRMNAPLVATNPDFIRAELGLSSELGAIPENARIKTVHRLALRGLIHDHPRVSRYTRRVIDLVNHTARALFATGGGGDSSPLTRLPRPAVRDTLLTFHAYYEHFAPPVFALDPDDERHAARYYPGLLSAATPNPAPLVMHEVCTPVIAALRDGWEYSDEARGPHDTDRPGAFYRLRRTPDQFNLERWSRLARQTGFYEYFYGSNFVAPHVYSTRLGNAIQRGYAEANTRTFLGECLPHLGLDGTKYYEIARLLWDVDSTVAAHRQDYCASLFGAVPRVQQAMVEYFNALEFYLSARPAEEQLTNLGQFSSYQGHGIIGRSGWISHLDYLLRNPTSPNWEVMPFTHPDLPFTRVWGLLQQAYRESGDNPVVRRRVQYFRRAFGLVRELVLAWHPVLTAMVPLESVVRRTQYEPMQWVQGQLMSGGFTRTTADIPDLRGGMRASAAEVRERVRGAIEVAVANRAAPHRGRNFTAVLVFRETIRRPIHRYLASPNVYGTTGDLAELGLGLGEYSGTTDEFSPVEINPTTRERIFVPLLDPETTWRRGWFLGEVVKYIRWWNAPAIRNLQRLSDAQRMAINTLPNLRPPTPERDDVGRLESLIPEGLRDSGVGVGMLWSMKRVIATLMTIRDDDFRPAFIFLGDA